MDGSGNIEACGVCRRALTDCEKVRAQTNSSLKKAGSCVVVRPSTAMKRIIGCLMIGSAALALAAVGDATLRMQKGSVSQALSFYSSLSGMELTIAPEATNHSKTITLDIDSPLPKKEAAEKIATALREQTGVLITPVDDKHASVTRPDDVAKQTSPEEKTESDDRSKCKDNLLKVSAAIEAYGKDHKDLPNWLSDLVPHYLAYTNNLICPVAARTGRPPPGMKDPNLSNAYHYEFNPSKIGADVQTFWGETDITMREWKQQQEKIVGGEIPIVRCFMHGDNSLDLTLKGEVRSDPLIWEEQFTNDKVKLKDLAPRPVTNPAPPTNGERK
jgi:hypothetical protein